MGQIRTEWRKWWMASMLAPYGLLLVGQQPTRPQAKLSATPSFAADIAPIFKAHCAMCHGADDPDGGLNLSSLQTFLKGGKSGAPFKPGKPGESLIIQRVKGLGGKPRMPMGFAPLSSKQIDLIERWIAAGAPTGGNSSGKHWAYIPPKKAALPKVSDPSWVKNPIDAFILSRLDKEGLKPSKPASKAVLARRAYLDITGLPPSPEVIDAFVADRRADAYERLVDRLLASPQYGERMAQIWLDLARYADSNGYEADFRRTAWKYRDWVIDAYNRNMPFDQFTIEQIAGDLLPHPTQSQLIATGFNRNTMFNSEGGVDPAEYQFYTQIDRLATTSTVWLGSTLACARCHDHKYDPFTQKDFYKFLAFYANTEYTVRGDNNVGSRKFYEPEIEAPSPEQVVQRDELKAQLASADAELKAFPTKSPEAFESWKRRIASESSWSNWTPSTVSTSSGAVATIQSDGSVLISGKNPPQDDYTITGNWPGGRLEGLRLDVLPDDSLGGGGPGRAYHGNFVLTGVRLKVAGQEVLLKSTQADFAQAGYDTDRLVVRDPANGWAIIPETKKPHWVAFDLRKSVEPAAGAPVELILEQHSVWDQHNIGKFKVSFTSSESPLEKAVEPVLKILAAKTELTADELTKLRTKFIASSEAARPLREKSIELKSKLDMLQASIPTAMVMKELPTGPPKANIHHRGEFMSPEEEVVAGTPAFLPPMPTGAPINRLGLAKWLVSPANPLTARVQVNRLWERIFGSGIVSTLEDFGTQCSPPTHPELLDWLASEFRDNGWNLKAIVKLIVTSNTYRQDSAVSEELLKVDPNNRLLARGPRFRLEAESVRDVALAASGLLVLKVGGPSVYPTQPEGIWDSPYSGERWQTSKGQDRFRRGIYTFWKRTAPYPTFVAFDATSREECTARRIRTNTPLQALALLNDPAVIEASKALARRMIARDPDRPELGLEYGFRLCVGRKPSSAELTRLIQLRNDLQKEYAANPGQATKLAGSVVLATWTMVANTLLNLDETITKG